MKPIKTFKTSGAPFLPPKASVSIMMLKVLIALIPGIVAYCYFFGWGIIIQIILASSFALIIELTCLKLRKKPIKLFLTDYSAVITAVLFALCLPPLIPWWISLTGMLFAIAIAKQLYGGLGYNIFNPAMIGYVVILIAFPKHATQWISPIAENLNLLDTLQVIFTQKLPNSVTWDSISQATILDTIKTHTANYYTMDEIRTNPLFTGISSYGWDWVAIGYLIGGLWLWQQKIISWHISLVILGSTLILTTPFYLFDPSVNPDPLSHIFAGGMMLGAFFIATDPVSASTTPKGRIVYALGIAIITLTIRRWGGYPEGFAFAVLLMNMLVPLIDHYTQPRVYGEKTISKDT